MLSKVIDTLIQMTVVLALYVPIIVGARWWGARKMRKALGAPFDANKCFCGKWRMPSALGIENDLPVRAETVDATDTRWRAITFTCPECGTPHTAPMVRATFKASAEVPQFAGQRMVTPR